LSVLKSDGLVVSQGESPFYEIETQKSLLKVLADVFPRTHIYNFTNMTYPGGLWSFTLASKKYCPIKDFSAKRVAESGLEFGWYNADIHRSAFCLPEFMRRELVELLTPTEE